MFADVGPEAAGLKTVAEEAGVSHGLVTHYFGTYDSLVEAAMEEHIEKIRAALMDLIRPGLSPGELIDALFAHLADPVYGRFFMWAIASGRFKREDFFPRRKQAPKQIADALESLMRSTSDVEQLDREELEFRMILTWCAALGYSMGRSLMWQAFGHQPSNRRDEQFRRRLADLLVDQQGEA